MSDCQKRDHRLVMVKSCMYKKEKMKMLKGLLVVLAIGALFLSFLSSVSSAWAYEGVNHNRATDPALDGRVSGDAMEAIKQANRATDDEPYDPTEHFDRNPTKTSDQCFRESVKHVQDKIAEAIAAIISCNTTASIKAIGEALHKIQDFYAHSNFVDLTDAQQTTLRNAFDNSDIMDPNKVLLPTWLRLAAYYPVPIVFGWGAKYNPASYYPSDRPNQIPGFVSEVDPQDGKPYDHGLEDALGVNDKHKDVKPGEGKDDPNPGDGARPITRGGVTKTAFDWSMEAAQQHSKDLINQIIKAVGQDLWNYKFLNYSFPTPPTIPPSVPKPPGFPPSIPHIGPYPFMRLQDSTYYPSVFGLVPPTGGILDDGRGTAVFTLNGTVLEPTWFYTLYVSPDFLPACATGIKILKAREFLPDDGEFQQPITVSMVYNLSEIQGVKEASLKIYEFNLYKNATWSEVLNSILDMVNRTVTFQTTRFTIYGIGGEYSSVGGIVIPIDKSALLAPYIGLASTTMIGVVATVVYVKRVKRRKEEQ